MRLTRARTSACLCVKCDDWRRVESNELIRLGELFYLFSFRSLPSSYLLLCIISCFTSSLLRRSSSSFSGIPSPLDAPPSTRGKHSQSFSPFCDSISADIAAVSLDSSIRSDEDAAEGDMFARDEEKEREGQEEMKETGGIETENWYVWHERGENERKLG